MEPLLMSTHSSDLLSDEGIAGDQVLLFQPREDGAEVRTGADIEKCGDCLRSVRAPYRAPSRAPDR